MKSSVKHLPDTNVITRYFIRDDEALYERAKAFFDDVRDGVKKTVVLESVVAECVYVLTKIYKVPREAAAESLVILLRYKGIVNDDKGHLINALTLFAKGRMDIVDCILCVKSTGDGSALMSFDGQLNKASLAMART